MSLRAPRALAASGGSGVHHIAFDCADIFVAVERLRHRRALRAVSPNYFDDLTTRFRH